MSCQNGARHKASIKEIKVINRSKQNPLKVLLYITFEYLSGFCTMS